MGMKEVKIYHNQCDRRPRECIEFLIRDKDVEKVKNLVDALNYSDAELYYYEVKISNGST